MFFRCHFTVSADTFSTVAIFLFDIACASSATISRSRSLNESIGQGAAQAAASATRDVGADDVLTLEANHAL